MKAKSDLLLKKRSEVKRAILTQRKVAQRQRRERERAMMRQARERQDKINQQKEVEVRKTELVVREGSMYCSSTYVYWNCLVKSENPGISGTVCVALLCWFQRAE